MIKTDDLYLDTLKEFVYDDKKVVTYKFLSVYLGVHVNLAKQMLYTFRERERKAGKKIYSLLYVSGITNEALGSQESGDDSPREENEKHVVLLCKDSDFERIKDKFKKLLSVHVYCVSSFPIEDYGALEAVVKKGVEIEGQSPVDYGPFTCNNDLKPSTKVSVAGPAPVKVKEEVKGKPKEPVKVKEEAKPEPEETKKQPVKPQSKSKNFFGAHSQTQSSSSSKSGAKKTPAQSSIQSSMSKMKPSVKTEKPAAEEEKNGKMPNKGKKNGRGGKSVGRSRKRIRLNSASDSDDDQAHKRPSVFTSSEDEDSDSDDSQGSPRSKRKSRILISSDSEEEVTQAVVASPSPQRKTPPEDNKARLPGRKRITKVVDKTFIDKDGYLVTKKETVVVSEAEGENGTEMECDEKHEETAVSKSDKVVDTKPNLVQVQSSKEQKTNVQPAKKTNGVIKTATSSSQPKSKTKQASIMNFFQKK